MPKKISRDNSHLYYHDIGLLIIRIGLGIVFFVSGLGKIVDISPTITSFTGLFGMLGPLLAWTVALVELGGSISLILGLFPRIFALLLSIVMLVAIITVQYPNMITSISGGSSFFMAFRTIQVNILLLLGHIGIFFTGPGRYSLERYIGPRWKM
ncbi:MAG: DoxX family protein [Candidatus Woesearchaeota archaeon]